MSRPPRRFRRRTYRLRRRWHRVLRPLRRPARVAVALAVLAVVGLGAWAQAERPLTSTARAPVDLGPDSTAVVGAVTRGDFALAGLREGDRVLVHGDTMTADRAARIREIWTEETVGDTARVVVERGGQRLDLAVVAGRQDARDARQFGLSALAVNRVLRTLFSVAFLAFAAAGGVLFVRARARGYRAALGTSLMAVGGMLAFGPLTSSDVLEGAGPAAVAFAVVATVVAFAALPTVAGALVRFPDGRPGRGWTRHAGRIAAAGLAGILAVFVVAAFVGPAAGPPPVLEVVLGVVLTAIVALPAVGLAVKYRRASDAVVRQQVKWVLLPLGAFVALLVVSFLGDVVAVFDSDRAATGYLFDTATNALLSLSVAAVPLGVLAGAANFRPWDADQWIARSAAVGAATLGLAAVFAGGAEALRLGLRASMGDGAEAVAAALAAVAALVVFNPVREWLTRRADADLIRTRERVGERLPLLLAGRQVVASPQEIGRVALAAVGEAFETERGAVIDLDPSGWEVVAATGIGADAARAWAGRALDPAALPACSEQVWEDPAFVLRVPLRSAEDEVVGVLALGTHGRGRGYSTDERRVLDGMARSLAEALRVAERREEAEARQYARLARLVNRVTDLGGDGAAVEEVRGRRGEEGE